MVYGDKRVWGDRSLGNAPGMEAMMSLLMSMLDLMVKGPAFMGHMDDRSFEVQGSSFWFMAEKP